MVSLLEASSNDETTPQDLKKHALDTYELKETLKIRNKPENLN